MLQRRLVIPLSQVRRALVAIFLSFTTLLAMGADARELESRDLDLVIEVMGRFYFRLSPAKYDKSTTADFFTLETAQQKQFLELRQDKLARILKRLRARIVDPSLVTDFEPGWIVQKVMIPVQTIDNLLFMNARLITSPIHDQGHLYSAQAAAYWGWGKDVKGVVFELSLLRERLADGRVRTTLSIDKLKVTRAYLPVPMASLSGRYLFYWAKNSHTDQFNRVNIDHLPLGLVTLTGVDHLGMGGLAGLSIPPAPIGTFTGFTVQRETSRIIYACETALASPDESEIELD